jgi:P4 family phage/plasmid primase-like protien
MSKKETRAPARPRTRAAVADQPLSSPTDLGKKQPPKSKRQAALEAARYQAQTQGGEAEDFLNEQPHKNGKWKGDGYQSGEAGSGNVVKEYFYLDKDGEFYLRIQRTDEKQFYQSHWEGNQWKWGRPQGPKIPYMLPELIAAKPEDKIYFTEGEKDADNVSALGLVATCIPEGTKGAWPEEINKYFNGKKIVYVLEDADGPGRRFVKKVAHNLSGTVSEIRIVSLPGLKQGTEEGHGGDVSDWLKDGGTKEKLIELCAAAPLYKVECILDLADPMRSARAIVDAKYISPDEHRILHRYRGTFWWWTGSHYQIADEETVRADIWQFLERAYASNKDGKLVAFKPNRARVGDVCDALGAVLQLDKYTEPPAWLTSQGLPTAEFFAAGNGLLHLPTQKLYPPTPDYFGISASEVMYDKNAPPPHQWLNFLNQTIIDKQAIETTQEWFGYTLSPDLSQQKIFFGVGPRRSGKGTLARIHKALLGNNSVAGPPMSSLGETFGLEPLITKPLAIVSDARVGGRSDKSLIVERLLSISGEDAITVARKFLSAWHGRLPTRIMILTNELPSLAEGSGALVGRFIVIVFQQSFYGNEDIGLTGKLKTELPGVLNWAIEGYQRLMKRGHFVQPANAQGQIDTIEMLGSPVKAFIRDCCECGPGKTVAIDEIFLAWQTWSTKEGRRDGGTKEWFGRGLHAAVPGLRITRPIVEKKLFNPETKITTVTHEQERTYEGIGLIPRLGRM